MTKYHYCHKDLHSFYILVGSKQYFQEDKNYCMACDIHFPAFFLIPDQMALSINLFIPADANLLGLVTSPGPPALPQYPTDIFS